MIKTYAIKWDEKILVTSQNKDSLVWYEFIQEEYPSEEHFYKLQAWYSYNIKTWEFEETQESIEFEKQEKIKVLLEKAKEWDELRTKYLSAEILPDSELKTEKLRVLHEKWQEVMTQYLQLETELVEKYGMEILEEIL